MSWQSLTMMLTEHAWTCTFATHLPCHNYFPLTISLPQPSLWTESKRMHTEQNKSNFKPKWSQDFCSLCNRHSLYATHRLSTYTSPTYLTQMGTSMEVPQTNNFNHIFASIHCGSFCTLSLGVICRSSAWHPAVGTTAHRKNRKGAVQICFVF